MGNVFAFDIGAEIHDINVVNINKNLYSVLYTKFTWNQSLGEKKYLKGGETKKKNNEIYWSFSCFSQKSEEFCL